MEFSFGSGASWERGLPARAGPRPLSASERVIPGRPACDPIRYLVSSGKYVV